MRASDLLGRARREDRRRRDDQGVSTDPPYFPFYSKRLDSAGRFLQSNLVDVPAEYARGVYEEAGDIAADAGSRIIDVALKCMAVFAGLALTLAFAVFLYAALYLFVVPQKEYNFPLFFDYGGGHRNTALARQQVTTTTTTLPQHGAAGAEETSSTNLVSTSILQHVAAPALPLATVNLLSSHTPWNITDLGRKSNSDGGDTVGTHLLVAGQPYTATVRLVLPESPSNVGLPGALMVNVELLASGNRIMARSARPLVMRHRSWPVRWARWATLTPAFIVGLIDEAQTHSLICFDKYVEAGDAPLAAVRVWLSDGRAQVYRGDLFVIAELKGMGYYMYHWFFTSWVVGVSVLWFWNMFGFLLVYALCCVRAEGGARKARVDSSRIVDSSVDNWASSRRDGHDEYRLDRQENSRDERVEGVEEVLRRRSSSREGRAPTLDREEDGGDVDFDEDEGDLAEILARGTGGETKKKDQ